MKDIAIGFDPSLTHFGWAVAEYDAAHPLVPPTFVECGVLVTKPSDDDRTKTEGYARRCESLARALFGLVEQWGRPGLIACEAVALPWGKTSMQTVSALGRVRGLIDALAASQALTVREFQPAVLKRLVTGDKSATKEAVEAAVVRAHPELAQLFAQLTAANVEHAADAAAALHAALVVAPTP